MKYFWFLFKGIRFIFKHPKGWYRILLNQVFALLRLNYAPCLPTFITLEPTNLCDLRCPVCETGAQLLNRKKGMMSLTDFKRVIDQIARHTNTLIFYFMGEPFLNEEAYEMISYARKRGIFVNACTNGHYVNPKRLLDTGIDEISFQIGGVTQETHQKYRVNGDLMRTLHNVKALVEERRKHPYRFETHIVLGFILMKHNEHEVREFQRLGKEIGVDEAQVIPACVRTIEQGREMLPENKADWIYDPVLFEKGVLRHKQRPHNKCWLLWNSTVITWNGDILPCCRDPQGEFVMGNIFKSDLKEIWNNSKYVAFRKRILQEQTSVDMCDLCSGFGI